MSDKWIALLHNRKRFESDLYDSNTPIVSETNIKWIKFPRKQMRKNFNIKETFVNREDNLFMDLYGVTEQDESAFDLNPIESKY